MAVRLLGIVERGALRGPGFVDLRQTGALADTLGKATFFSKPERVGKFEPRLFRVQRRCHGRPMRRARCRVALRASRPAVVLDFMLAGSPGAAGHLAEGPVPSYTLAQAHHRARMGRLRIHTHDKQ
ncbi:hypothetical protein M885DRAFT_529806, partial [Pelagophyceae sp. CCMP2097]